MISHFKSTHRRALASAVALILFAACNFAAAATICVAPGGKSGCKPTISSAVAIAAAGDIINVAAGTYADSVTITKPVSIIGDPTSSPVIDATGQSTGIFVNGMSAAPLPGIANVLISGLTVKSADFEGILVANGTNIMLVNNHVHNNNKALKPGGGGCPGIPAFETNEGEDCGEGVHLMAVDHSSVIRNLVENNSGGILISDETGPTSDNYIRENTVRYNGWDCGITLASHGPATSVIPTAHLPFGIWRNVISHNDSHHNGLLAPGAGAGVGIFAPSPGTANFANVVIGNQLYDNGLPGVTMHNHAFAPSPAPGVNLNDNVIVGNSIYGNAADTQDAFTSGPTGINVYSLAPITGLVIEQNIFTNESIDIAIKAPGGWANIHFNDFNDAGVGIQNAGIFNVGSATINGTQNWWNCVPGTTANCAKDTGPKVTTAPRLKAPF